MRADELRDWRSRATIAIVVGLLGGLALAGYAVFWLAVNGLASSGCEGGGCEQRLSNEAAHYNSLLLVALFVGGGLIVAGGVTRRMVRKRLRDFEPAPLPVATVVERPETGRDLP